MQLSSKKYTVTAEFLMELSFILYFCFPLLRRALAFILTLAGASRYAVTVAILVAYAPLVIAMVKVPKRFPVDFLLLLGLVISFFAVSYLIHPEYEFWYEREYYGVWDYALRPDNGIYAYLFIRLVNDPKKILQYLRICAFVMLVYYLYLYIEAWRQGYWVEKIVNGEEVRRSYSLQFGFDVLPFALLMLYSALQEKKPIYWAAAIIGVVMIVGGGSRGAVLDILIFLAVYLLCHFKVSRKNIILTLSGTIAAVFFVLYYHTILAAVALFMQTHNIQSRFITYMLNGAISDDTGRSRIWAECLQMIRRKPWGYGAMGSRHVIYDIIEVGHPHNLFLEILVDFGVIVGTVIIVAMIVRSIRILRMKSWVEWRDVFLIFFGTGCQLLLSGTFWHRMAIWAALGVSICLSKAERKNRGQNVVEQ